ncbi:hypothetical protein AM493_04780 [Flavobacterium akiainvivens]|uniref:HTH araC/xylS-type domain-containing protein n=1 Tax=Flavobacterium akiainvivens TaxID=1202724 RepID=A0A0M9VHD4_9FLAO|nr:AraC family transcriptional regulator [Flavobacterium akiainvivens]KOS05420.1 hypothetical protein AM493_04780 [Flavobacterium akiainvivens]SFQ78159.1 AraC-type DNA-binding protein [Flavobacterium akiainvivens]
MVPSRFPKVALLSLLLTYFSSYAYTAPDSLQQKDYKYLFTRIRATKANPVLQDLYLKAFLKNAKDSGDWEMIMHGYKNYADFSEEMRAVMYSDSMVYAARQLGDGKLIGAAYLSKGIVYYDFKRHEMALENYLLARPYIEKEGDDYLTYKLKYNIAHVKYYLGKNSEAILLFNACLDYFKENNTRAYLNTLHSLGLCYNRAGNYGKSEQLVDLGLAEASRLGDHSMDCYFLHLDGQNDYFLKNYSLSIEKLQEAIPGVAENDDYANIAVANFYIGKSYWAIKRFREGLPYLHLVADAFDQKEYIRPDLRENFELLINYYKDKGDSKKVLYYVDRLLSADSLLTQRHDRLYDTIHKNYDTRELFQEKKDIELQFKREQSYGKIWQTGSVVLSIIVVVLVVAHIVDRKRRDQVFRELMENKKPKQKAVKAIPKELPIPQETVTKVLARLEKWEQAMRYLDVNITRASMAVYLDTNVHYVSDIILHYRGKSFTEYINDLKVDYIIEQLKTDRHKRMFTHDALAEEAGFSTTQRFVQAFKSRTTLSPTFFSAKIRKEMAEG